MSRLEARADRHANIIADNANRGAHVAERLSNLALVAAGGLTALELYKKRTFISPKTTLAIFAAGVVLKATSGVLDMVVDRVNTTNGLS